jgi:serine/threonine-protein kinase SRPK3
MSQKKGLNISGTNKYDSFKLLVDDEITSDDGKYFTIKHFTPIDTNDKYLDSESDSDSNQDSDSDSDSESGSGSGSGSGSESESESGSESDSDSESKKGSESKKSSKSDSDNCSESESVSESETMYIDEDDLFNSKTNGNEFYGEVLKNRYLILKKLGYGSFSSVWMAYDIDSNNLVAIKIINPYDFKEGYIELQTYKKLETLDHTYLLTMIDYFQVVPIHSKYYTDSYSEKNRRLKNHIVMILPLMACSTYDLLKCNQYDDGLPLEVCTNIMKQTLEALGELERNNLMHTDLKPENILVCGLNREAEMLLKTIIDIDIKTLHHNHLIKLTKSKPNMSEENRWLLNYKIYKEITKIIIHFMKTEMKDVKRQMKQCKVSSNYINNIRIKLCDFNLVINTDDGKIGDKDVQIQTRYYRAPEIILKAGLHKKSDYWSLGCVFFELLTGDILFDPEKDKSITRDVHHIYLIEELIGPIPKTLLDQSKNYHKIYTSKGLLINVEKKIKKWCLEDVLKENYNNIGLDNKKIKNIINFINLTLTIIPDNRPNIKTMMNLLKEM